MTAHPPISPAAADFADRHGIEGLPEHALEAVLQARRVRIGNARIDAAEFCEFVLRDEKTGTPIRMAQIHRAWHKALDESPRMVLHSSIESGKTVNLSVGRMLWEVGRDPNVRCLVVSNTFTQATKLVRAVAGYVESSQSFREVFPDCQRGEPWRDNAITTRSKMSKRDPSLQAVGVKGAIIGARVDRMALDDVLDRENTLTARARGDLLEWFNATLLGRLTKDGRAWFVGTAWDRDDLLFHLAKPPSIWTHRRFPIVDAEGRSSWPANWPIERIAAKRIELGEAEFARQMMCRPRSDEEARFKREWIESCLARGAGVPLVQRLTELPEGCATFTGVDVGVRTHEGSDRTAICTLLLWPDGTRQVLWLERGRWSGPEIIRRIAATHERYQSIVYVENSAAQLFIVQFAAEYGKIPVRGFMTGANKAHPDFGVEGIAVEMENQKWCIPSINGRPASKELEEWIDELLYYDPREHTGDNLMASWMAREGARRFSASRKGGVGIRVFG